MLIVGPSSGVASSEHEAEAAMSDTEPTEAFLQVDEALPLASAGPTLQTGNSLFLSFPDAWVFLEFHCMVPLLW